VNRMSVVTDWRTRDEDLPDVPPGGEYERTIAPQKFVALRRIVALNLVLVRLRIGAVDDVPFELESADGRRRTYRPMDLDDAALRERIAAVGAAVVAPDAIAIAPGLEVRVVLRNETATPAKPRVALLVQEEIH